MTAQEAQERAKEVAKSLGLSPEETGTLVSGAAKLAALDVEGLDQASRDHHLSAQRAPRTRLVGAQHLFLTMLREEGVIVGLPDDAAREDYTARMHGIGRYDGVEPVAEPEPDPAQAAEREAATQKKARAAQIAELYKHPAMMDAKHAEHGAVVAQLVKLNEE